MRLTGLCAIACCAEMCSNELVSDVDASQIMQIEYLTSSQLLTKSEKFTQILVHFWTDVTLQANMSTIVDTVCFRWQSPKILSLQLLLFKPRARDRHVRSLTPTRPTHRLHLTAPMLPLTSRSITGATMLLPVTRFVVLASAARGLFFFVVFFFFELGIASCVCAHLCRLPPIALTGYC